MPMRNSTLIYFVNQFHLESELFPSEAEMIDYGNTLAVMDNAEMLPSDRTIENILNFARSYEVLETEETGYVEMNLN